MIAIVDYGVGNLFSLKSSFEAINAETVVTSDPEVLRAAEKIILPGVGAFKDAADKLRESGLDQVVIEEAKKGKPLMGICLGMQLLFDESEEYGNTEGLGLISGKIVSMKGVVPDELKIPQMGWNYLKYTEKGAANPLFRYIKEGDFVYFVHSFYAAQCDESILAYTEYGAPITAVVSSGNVYGCQFHPEKSGNVGLNILKAFVEM